MEKLKKNLLSHLQWIAIYRIRVAIYGDNTLVVSCLGSQSALECSLNKIHSNFVLCYWRHYTSSFCPDSYFDSYMTFLCIAIGVVGGCDMQVQQEAATVRQEDSSHEKAQLYRCTLYETVFLQVWNVQEPWRGVLVP